MKILLAAASFATSISGLQRHAFNVARCLLLRPEIRELHVVVAPWQSDMPQAAGLPSDVRLTIHIAEIDRSSLSRNLWYYYALPRLATRLQADLVHFSYPVPVNASAFRCPTVVSLHDLYPYEIPMNFGFPKCLFNRMVLRQCLRKADAIACVSQATRMRLKRYLDFPGWSRSVCIHNCVEPTSTSATHQAIPAWSGEKFLLCVAQHRRNKNIAALIRTVDRLWLSRAIDPSWKLIVIGMRGPETRNIHRLAAAPRLKGRIQFLEGVSESDLQWFYRHCEALVAPSLTEGFGLPVAEALLAGCRIVCSDIAAHREFADGHCRFVSLDGDFEPALAAALVETLKQPRTAPVPLPQLSASTIAQQYLVLYRKLLASTAIAATDQFVYSEDIRTAESRPL